MGLPWIQVDVGFSSSAQAIDMADALSVDVDFVVGKMVRVWSWCAQFARDGFVRARKPARLIEDAARWQGAPGDFFAAAELAGLLEVTEEGARVRGWSKRYGARLEKNERDAKRLREVRSQARRGDATETPQARSGDVAATDCDDHATSRGEKEKENKKEEETHVEQPPVCVSDIPNEQQKPAQRQRRPRPPSVPTPDELAVFECWVATMGRTGNTLFVPKRLGPVRDRLAEGYTPEDLKKAIAGCARSDFHMARGEHAGKALQNDLAQICADGTRVERFIAMADAPERAPPKNGATSDYQPLPRLRPEDSPYYQETQ
jgi:hypothetical protein